MAVSRDQLEVISNIYDAVLDQRAWVGILDDVADRCGAIGSAIGLADTNHAPVQIETGNSLYSRELLRDYNRRFQADNATEYQNLIRCDPCEMARDTTLFAGEDVPASERPTLTFLRKHFGIAHRAAARLNSDGAWIGAFTLQHHEHHGPMTNKEAAIAKVFLPHIAKALELTRPFMLLKARFRAVMAALDRFHVGVLIFSAGGHIVLRNREAERILDLKDGLLIDHSGHLVPANEADRRALQEAILRATATAGAQANQAETRLLFPRRSQSDPFLADVAPIRDRGDELDTGFAGAMMFIVDPMHTEIVSTANMQLLYSLTETEAEICRLIAQGYGTPEVADVRSLTRETVRTHVKRILNKTRTANRAQLVRLALTVNLPIDTPDGMADPDQSS